MTPLAWAALHGRTEAAAWLLDNGADIGSRNRDGSTALHSAAFVGRTEIVQLLLERGADANAVDANGARPLDSTQADAETTAWIAGLLSVSYDETGLREGREETATLLVQAMERKDAAADFVAERTDAAGGVAPYREDADTNVDEGKGLLVPWYWSALYRNEWGRLFTQDVFSHLWFLWYLVWLAVALILVAWATARLGLRLPRLPERLVVTPALYLWAVPLTMATQYFMGIEGQFPVFGADTYTGLLPAPHVLVYYGVFFAFGAIYFAHNEGSTRIGRWWQMTLPLALIVFLAGVVLTFPEEGGTAQGWARAGSLFLQAAYVWMMILCLMGLFRAALGVGNAPVRYLYGRFLLAVPDASAADHCTAGRGAGLAAALDCEAGAAGGSNGGRPAAHLRMGSAVHAGRYAVERTPRAGTARRGLTMSSSSPLTCADIAEKKLNIPAKGVSRGGGSVTPSTAQRPTPWMC